MKVEWAEWVLSDAERQKFDTWIVNRVTTMELRVSGKFVSEAGVAG